MTSLSLLFLLVTGGAFVTSLTGFGGGTLILAGLMLVYPPELAIPLHSFTQITANGIRTGIFFKRINWKVVFWYSLLMLPGAFLGAKVFTYVNSDYLKLFVGLSILFSLLPFALKPKEEPSHITFLGLGFISAFLGVFVGAVGPMVTQFFNRLKLDRNGMLSTKSAGQMFLQFSKIVAFWGATDIDFLALKDKVGILVLGSSLGVLLSIPIGKKMSDDKFNLIINVLMGVIACKLIYESTTAIF